MITDYPNTLGTVVYHLNPPLATSFGNMRWGLYTGYYIPHSVHDGLYDAWPYTTYESKFLSRQAVTTDVTIDMTAFGGGETRQVNATVCIEPGGTSKTMKIWMVQVLDNFGSSYLTRNAVRAGNAGVEITLAPDECVTVTETFVLGADSLASPGDVKFFAWAQDPVFVQVPDPSMPPGGYSWAEVHQANKALVPFEGLFIDGFESMDTSAWSSATP